MKRDLQAGLSKQRDPKWHKVEKQFLLKNPCCAACGSKNKLQVHHIHPFHLFPDRELDETNLMTLCMDKECHLKLGHGRDWRAYNPHVTIDIKQIHNHPHLLIELEEKAEKSRVYQ